MNISKITEEYLNSINALCKSEKDNAKLIEMRDYAQKRRIPIVLAETASLLSIIIKIKQPKSILEIGTAIGYSGALMLVNCGGRLTTIDKNEKCIEIAEQNFTDLHLKQRVKLCAGDAKDVLNSLLEQKKSDMRTLSLQNINKIRSGTLGFDFIFLDGPKAQYLHYLPALIELLNGGGILFADNVLFKGFIAGEESSGQCLADNVQQVESKKSIVNNLREFNKQITQDSRLQTSILNVGDGVSVSVKIVK